MDINIDDLKRLAIAAGKAGVPFVEQAITLALAGMTGPFGLLVSPVLNAIFPMINDALGLSPDTPADQTAAAIDADPDAAKDKLSALAEDHQFQLALAKQGQDFTLAGQAQQIAVDQVEAQNPSWLVAGWRPSAAWVCVVGLALDVLVLPLVQYAAAWGGRAAPPPPDATVLIGLLGALLGLGTLRTYDKVKGVAFNGVGSGTTRMPSPPAAAARRK